MPTPVLSIRFTVSNLLPRLGVLALLGAPACGDDTTPGDETGSTGEDTTSGMTSPTTMTTAPSTMTMTTMGGVDSTDDGMDTTDDGMVTTDDGMVTTDDGMDTTTGGEDSTSTGMDSSSGGSESSTGDLCGNDMIDAGEDCDGTDLGDMECTDVGGGFVGGTLACNTDCTFDTTACVLRDCGNGTIEGSEACDGAALGGATCETAGFPLGGVLACDAASCQLDTSGCLVEEPGDTCENGILVDPTMLPYSDTGSTLDYNNDYGYSSGVCPGEGGGWNDGSEDVVYEFTPDTTGVYTIEFDAPTYDSTVYMVTDCADVDGTCVAGADALLTSATPETIVATLNAGTTYFIIGGHYSNDTLGLGWDYTLTISDACVPAACDGISCGDDGCGGTCECNVGDVCDAGTCAPIPAGDTCEDPIVVDPTALPYSDSSDTGLYSNDYGYSSGVCPGESGSGNGSAEDVVYSFIPETTGTYYIEFVTTYDSTVYVVTDCASVDTSCVAGADNGNPEHVFADLTAGTEYFIIGGGWFSADGPYTLNIQEVTLGGQGDTCSDPLVIDPTALPYSDSGNSLFFNNDYGYGTDVCPGETGSGNAGAEDVVYSFTPDTTGTYHIEFLTAYDSTVYVVTDCASIDGTCVAGANNANPEEVVVDLVAGTTYFIIGGHASNFTSGTGGGYTLNVEQVTLGGPGDTCGDPIVIDPLALPYADSSNTLFFNNDYGYSAGVCPGETSGWNDGAEDVVYSFTPNASGSYTIVFDTTWDSTVYMVTDCANVDGTCVAGADNGNPETITADLTAGTTYFIIGGHWSNDALYGGGPYDLSVTMN